MGSLFIAGLFKLSTTTDFQMWKRRMLDSLRINGMHDALTDVTVPTNTNSKVEWEAKQFKTKAFIASFLESDIYADIDAE